MTGPGITQGPRRALLLIDIENEFLHPDGVYGAQFSIDAAPMLEAVRRLVAWAHDANVSVIWVRLAFRTPDNYDAVRDPLGRSVGALEEGTWGTQLLEGLGRRDDDIVVTKKRPSAFFNTDLVFVLRGLGIEQLIVGGVSTNWAVESTVRDGHSHDYEMVVVTEATATPFAALHEPSLRSMGSVFARVVALEDVIRPA